MTTPPTVLVLGGTGKTGSRLASGLRARGLGVRTAARSAADVVFDWDDTATHAAALAGADRVYLVSPIMRNDFARDVAAFLNKAEDAGVQHVTYLSAYGVENAPPGIAMRDVELDLIGRHGFGHSLLRPAWFMQNFSEAFLRPTGGVVAVPTGVGTEAFVDAEDIAAVAAETLVSPAEHAGAAYALTGPEALSVADAATRSQPSPEGRFGTSTSSARTGSPLPSQPASRPITLRCFGR